MDNGEKNEHPATPLTPPPPPSPTAHTTGSAGGSPPFAAEPLTPEPLTPEPHVMGASPSQPPLPQRILATPDPVASRSPGTKGCPATSLRGGAFKHPWWHSDHQMD